MIQIRSDCPFIFFFLLSLWLALVVSGSCVFWGCGFSGFFFFLFFLTCFKFEWIGWFGFFWSGIFWVSVFVTDCFSFWISCFQVVWTCEFLKSLLIFNHWIWVPKIVTNYSVMNWRIWVYYILNSFGLNLHGWFEVQICLLNGFLDTWQCCIYNFYSAFFA